MTTATNATHIYETIQTHLASGGVVALVTQYRQTIYEAKHASWFSRPKDQSDRGVYVESGRKRIYLFPHQLRFGRYVTAE